MTNHSQPSRHMQQDRWDLVEVDNKAAPRRAVFRLTTGSYAGLEIVAALGEVFGARGDRAPKLIMGYRGGHGFFMRYLDNVSRATTEVEMRFLQMDSTTRVEVPRKILILRGGETDD